MEHETKLCPKCGFTMIKRYEKEILLTNPPQRRWDWWCGFDDYSEVGGTDRGMSENELLKLQWEQANKPNSRHGDRSGGN